MGNAYRLVLGVNDRMCEDVEGEGEGKKNFLAIDYRTPALSGRCVVAYR